MTSTKTHVFANWTEAAANAKKLLNEGEIDRDEYEKVVARARKERLSEKKPKATA